MNSPTKRPDSDEAARNVLARYSHAAEFSRRQRHRKGWVMVIASALFALAVVPAVWGLFSKDWRVRLLWFVPAGLGFTLLRALQLYSKGSPGCPQCHEDITNCFPKHCHVCGEALNQRLCTRCGVDRTWTAGFQAITLLREPIRFCPGCGIFLGSTFYRYEQEGS